MIVVTLHLKHDPGSQTCVQCPRIADCILLGVARPMTLLHLRLRRMRGMAGKTSAASWHPLSTPTSPWRPTPPTPTWWAPATALLSPRLPNGWHMPMNVQSHACTHRTRVPANNATQCVGRCRCRRRPAARWRPSTRTARSPRMPFATPPRVRAGGAASWHVWQLDWVCVHQLTWAVHASGPKCMGQRALEAVCTARLMRNCKHSTTAVQMLKQGVQVVGLY